MIRLTLAALAAAAFLASCGDDDSSAGQGPAEPTQAAVKDDNEAAAPQEEKAAPAEPAAKPKKGSIVRAVDSQFGRVIADKTGEALYLFDKEKGKRSECYGECAVVWPPLLTKGKPRVGIGARKGLLGTTRRRNGKLQVTYAGRPVYYFQNDSPGNILCHNVDEFGGLWLVFKPSGVAVS